MYQFVEALYRQHAAELTTALALSANDREAAADLVHEVFLKAMLKEDHLREHPDPRGWLFRTGYNLARNRLALLARRRYKVGREYCVIEPRAWEEVIDLREALRKLSRRQRDAVILHYYVGFSVEETAQILGCAEGSVLSHLHRGRKALDRLLGTQEAAR